MKLNESIKLVLLNEYSFLDKLKALNPTWDPKKAKGDFRSKEFSDDDSGPEEHETYLKDADIWLDKISAFEPTIKVGDWVKVWVKGGSGLTKPQFAIGKIKAETTIKGHNYGWLGYKGPSKIPAWEIKVFIRDVDGQYDDKWENDYISYNEKMYMGFGTLFYALWDENDKEGFTKLVNQNIKVETIDKPAPAREPAPSRYGKIGSSRVDWSG